MVQFNLNHEKFILDYPIDRIIPSSGQMKNQLLAMIIYCQWNYHWNQLAKFTIIKLYTITQNTRSYWFSRPLYFYDLDEVDTIMRSYVWLEVYDRDWKFTIVVESTQS